MRQSRAPPSPSPKPTLGVPVKRPPREREAVPDQDDGRRIWIVLDELPTLHEVPSLQPELAESHQFGACFVLGIRVISALRDLYGRNGAETISDLCGTRVVLAAPDKDSAQWFADSLGRSEIREMSEDSPTAPTPSRDGVSFKGPGAVLGKVGAGILFSDACWHARVVGLILISVIRRELGSLDRVIRIVKVLGLVNAVPEFGQSSHPANACAWATTRVTQWESARGPMVASSTGWFPPETIRRARWSLRHASPTLLFPASQAI